MTAFYLLFATAKPLAPPAVLSKLYQPSASCVQRTMFAQGLSLLAGEPQQQSSLESIIEKCGTELYNSGSEFEPIDPNSTSVKMEIACQLLSSRLIHLGADPDKILNNDLKELSNVNWSTLDKKEKKRLSRTNSKYYMNFHDVEHDTKSKHFGEEWHYTFKELRRMEWVRFKFISNRERYTIFPEPKV